MSQVYIFGPESHVKFWASFLRGEGTTDRGGISLVHGNNWI